MRWHCNEVVIFSGRCFGAAFCRLQGASQTYEHFVFGMSEVWYYAYNHEQERGMGVFGKGKLGPNTLWVADAQPLSLNISTNEAHQPPKRVNFIRPLIGFFSQDSVASSPAAACA